MKVISLFDGISCGRVALEELGVIVEDYVAYEIDKNAIYISNKNYPDIKQNGSVIGADFSKYKSYDLLLGGSPCQDLSIQRRDRKGLEGNKSSLFWEYKRALDEVQPKWFLFENVAKMPQKDKDTITEALGVEPILIDAVNWLPQHRERLYWTNIPIGEINNEMVELSSLLEDDVDNKYFYNKTFIPKEKKGNQIGKIELCAYDTCCRVYGEHGIMPTLTCVVGGYQEKKIYIERLNKVRKLTPKEYERLQGLPDDYTAGVSDGKRYTACGNGWCVPVIKYILKGIDEYGTELKD